MKIAKLINEILVSIEKLIKNIKTLYSKYQRVIQKREKCNHIL